MKDFINKALLAGLGLASMTKEKIEEFASKMAEEGKMTNEEGKKFFDEIFKKSEQFKQDIENKIEESVKKVLIKLNIPTQDTINNLEQRIKDLEEKIEKLTNKQTEV